MTLYTFQAAVLGALLFVASMSRRRIDAFIGLFVCVWTIAVVFIYWHFGSAQGNFYSNDQVVQVEMVEQIRNSGLRLTLDAFISERYLVTVPAWLITKMGISSILALKFIQGLSFVLMYRIIQEHFTRIGAKMRTPYLILTAGPLAIFMSVLALRDVVLALFAVIFITQSDFRIRLVSITAIGLLRPHLAVALLFGNFLEIVFRKFGRKPNLLVIAIVAGISFLLGSFGYRYGLALRNGLWLEPNPLTDVLTKQKAILVIANFAGLQFLTFDQGVVNFTYINLLLLRVVFIDTFIIPLLFVAAMINCRQRIFSSYVAMFCSFVFFIGLVSQSEFNSSRQNLPFLIMMGVLVVKNTYDRKEDIVVQ